MITLDFILLGIIIIWAILGFRRGFLSTLGSLVGIILAILIASRFYPIVGDWFGGTNVSNIVAFVMLFGIITKLISIVFWILGKVFEVITVLPFISSFDKILGLVLGFAQGIFMLSAILYFLSKYPLNDWLTNQMGHSIVSATLLKMAVILIPLFPEAIKKLKSVI